MIRGRAILFVRAAAPNLGEFRWVGGKHVGGKYEWVYFDDKEWSETYTQRLIYCPACGQRFERMNLDAVKC